MPPSAKTRLCSSERSTCTSRVYGKSWEKPASSSKPSAASAIGFMSRGWSAPEIVLDGLSRIPFPRPRVGKLPTGDELGANHGHLAWSFDPEPDLPPFEPDDGHTDVVTDVEFFHQLPRQHQHGTLPSSTPGSILQRERPAPTEPVTPPARASFWSLGYFFALGALSGTSHPSPSCRRCQSLACRSNSTVYWPSGNPGTETGLQVSAESS